MHNVLKFSSHENEHKWENKWLWTNEIYPLPSITKVKRFFHEGSVRYQILGVVEMKQGGKVLSTQDDARRVVFRALSGPDTPENVLESMEHSLRRPRTKDEKGYGSISRFLNRIFRTEAPSNLGAALVLRAHITMSVKLDIVHPIHLEVVQPPNDPFNSRSSLPKFRVLFVSYKIKAKTLVRVRGDAFTYKTSK